ncbi:MAG: hypothetical protein Q9175_004437 [Cornicularia normoerica]
MPSKLLDLPNTITDLAVKSFLKKYYAVSNDAEVHSDYADLFTTDDEFSINDKKAKGTKHMSPQQDCLYSVAYSGRLALALRPPNYIYTFTAIPLISLVHVGCGGEH